MIKYFLLLLSMICSFADIGDIRLLTDNTPDWSSIDNAAKSITNSLENDEQKAHALFKYVAFMRHQVPPATDSFSKAIMPNKHPFYGIIYNPVKLANNYGNTFCVSTNSVLPLLWRKLGKEGREYDISAHTVCDLKWDNEWHHFDAAFGFVYKDTATGRILDVKEIAARQKNAVMSIMSDYTYCNRFDTGLVNGSIYQNTKIHNILNKTGEYSVIESVRETLHTERLSDSYSYRLRLKPFETYVRYFNQIADSLKYYLPVDESNPKNPNAAQKPYLNIVANGVWRFKPDFSSERVGGAFSVLANIKFVNNRMVSQNPKDTAEFVYKIDAANIICHAELRGHCEVKNKKSFFEILFSADSVNWIPLYKVSGKAAAVGSEFDVPFSILNGKNLARGRSEGYVKVKLKASKKSEDCALSGFSVTVYTIVNPRTLPALTLGSNRIKFLSSSPVSEQLAVAFYWSEYRLTDEGHIMMSRSYARNIQESSLEWLINTAGIRNPTMDSIVLSALPEKEKEGYSDGVDVGDAYESGKYYYVYGKCISAGLPISAKPTADSLVVLNDNSGGPRQSAVTWFKGANPEITMTMGQKGGVATGGVRFLQSLAGENDDYIDSCVVYTSRDNKTFIRRSKVTGRQVYDQVTNYLHPNSWDVPAYNGAKHRNIARYKFSAAFDSPDTIKSARFVFYNSRSQLRLEEIEVYDKMTKMRVVNEIDHGFALPDPSANKE